MSSAVVYGNKSHCVLVIALTDVGACHGVRLPHLGSSPWAARKGDRGGSLEGQKSSVMSVLLSFI